MLVRDAQGRYLPASVDQILAAARQAIELEKQRVIGGGPKFRKFGRRVMYAVSDLDARADARSYEAPSDPEYAERHAGDYRDRR